MPEYPTEEIEGYVLERMIGHGALGAVYLARERDTGRKVAIKLTPAHAGATADYAQQFFNEARLASRLEHPNLVRVYDYGRSGDHFYMVMEYVDGPSCRARINRQGKLPWRDAADIASQAARGLAEGLRNGVIHRDVKPANILIDERGEVRVADLGLAIHQDGVADLGLAVHQDEGADLGLTIHQDEGADLGLPAQRGSEPAEPRGSCAGTPEYMSPEQIESRPVDFRSDIYSLGATLFHMVCGSPPYTGRSAYEVMRQHLSGPLPPPRDYTPELPPRLVGAIEKMLAREPEDRYQSYEELIADLEALTGKGGAETDAARTGRAHPAVASIARLWAAGTAALAAARNLLTEAR